MIKGKIHSEMLASQILKGNPAGESSERIITTYTPPGYDPKRAEPYPLLIVLAPWTSAGRNQFDWKPFKTSLPERMEALVADGKMSEAVVVAPDLYTRYGGSQYVDSAFFGDHGRHIVKEVLPFVRNRFHVTANASGTGVFGRSSGGFGALRLATDFPGTFGRVASHSGDLGFETMFLGDLQSFPRLLARSQGDVESYVQNLWSKPKLAGGEVHLLMLLGMAGFYSPSQESPYGYHLPIDLHLGKIDWKVWKQWMQHDPVSIVENDAKALTGLDMLYIECGLRDQYHLLYGARQLNKNLKDRNIEHHYEEFDDNHSGTDYRYDVSLPLLSPV